MDNVAEKTEGQANDPSFWYKNEKGERNDDCSKVETAAVQSYRRTALILFC